MFHGRHVPWQPFAGFGRTDFEALRHDCEGFRILFRCQERVLRLSFAKPLLLRLTPDASWMAVAEEAGEKDLPPFSRVEDSALLAEFRRSSRGQNRGRAITHYAMYSATGTCIDVLSAEEPTAEPLPGPYNGET